MDNRPSSRDKNVLGGSGSVNRRGSGLGTGSVGTTNGRRPSGGGGYRPSGGSGSGGGGGLGGGLPIILIIGVIVVGILLFSGGGGNLLNNVANSVTGGSSVMNALTDLTSGAGNVADEFQIGSQGAGNWHPEEAELNTRVATGAREKYTKILGNGEDKVTLMVYLCGTDLESKGGMATSDLQEMMKAQFGDNVNLIVYTGGCKKWKNNVVANDKNQIYQVKNGQLVTLKKDAGKASMTKPETLTEFIQYCTKNFPANRNMLIFWDHGGGSISGYGYDERNASSGSMSLAEIDSALKNAGTKFDFIGFDACLMATYENAMMLADHADYMIASEETEPGVGWYYVNWLTALGKNTSMPTIEIGQKIVDDFVEVCDRRCNGQKTTLSVVDLAEFSQTVPDKMTAFAKEMGTTLQNDGYETISHARNKTREFAQSSKIDQVDLVNLAENVMGNAAKELQNAVLEAVKYNRTSANMKDANGVAIYFPYKKPAKAQSAVKEYEQLGMDSEYTKTILKFANTEGTGQSHAVQNGTSLSTGSPLTSLLGGLVSGGLPTAATDLLGSFTSDTQSQNYVNDHSLDPSKLVWKKDTDGKYRIMLSNDEWNLLTHIELNVFVDDGSGYIDLGLDNTFELDRGLVGEYDNTWLSFNGQIVAYYHLDSVVSKDHYSHTGYVPVMINGERCELIIVFDDARPNGYVAGARTVYKTGEVTVEPKSLVQLNVGDKLDFLCDYYDYEGNYNDTYMLGEQMTYDGSEVIGNLTIENRNVSAVFRFTDIYQQTYWTPAIP
ncbi:MAG: peptidase C11 [Lachnospiraceae bacterium]|nr:peptidase C11 [Lachnospiraceae bacterium]